MILILLGSWFSHLSPLISKTLPPGALTQCLTRSPFQDENENIFLSILCFETRCHQIKWKVTNMTFKDSQWLCDRRCIMGWCEDSPLRKYPTLVCPPPPLHTMSSSFWQPWWDHLVWRLSWWIWWCFQWYWHFLKFGLFVTLLDFISTKDFHPSPSVPL